MEAILMFTLQMIWFQPVIPKYRGTGGFTAEYKGIGISATLSYLAGCQFYNSTLVDRVENADIDYNVDRRLLEGRWTTYGQQTQ